MKNLLWKVSIFVFLILVLAFGLNLWYKSANPDEVEYFTSSSISASKASGTFLAEYEPVHSRIRLRYHTDSVEFFRLWTQLATKHDIVYLGDGIERRPLGYQLKHSEKIHFEIEYRQFPSEEYVFDINGHNGKNGRGILDLNYLPDTLTFEIFEKNPIDSIGWTGYLRGQKISFVMITK